MPAFRRRVAVKLPRNVTTFVELGAGVSRGEVPGGAGGKVNPANMIWIFGSGRSGSTWLRGMMADMKSHLFWEEPMVGRLFGQFYNNAQEGQLNTANFIMGEPAREGWIHSIRNFVLEGARYARPGLRTHHYLVIKEPNGSEGAPLLMEAFPESRMILLVRDPRDVTASVLDGARRGSWLYERKNKGAWKRQAVADNEPDRLVKNRSKMYLRQMQSAKQAYEAHRGSKTLVRYEDLLADTLEEMRRIYSELEIPVDEGELESVVEKHSWENIPEDQKGEGKFYRKGKAGGWREDLTKEQISVIEETTAPLLKEFYPGETG